MLVREYRDSDLSALRAIHAAQGFDYALPDLTNPLFITKLVLTLDSSHAENASRCSEAACCASVKEAPINTSPAPNQGNRSALTGSSPSESHGSRVTSHESPVTSHESPATSHESPATTILGAAFLRLTAEAYLLLDPRAGTPRQRWQWLLALHAAAERDAWQRGLEDVHAWLPPPISKKFGKRLARLGWLRDDTWTPYCKRFGVE